MKLLFYPLVLLFTAFSLQAQLRVVNSYPISVNYEKTVHLVFPGEVKYSSSVSDFVVIDNPGNAKNIIRIKANSKSFDKKTTVSVAIADGRFYTFDVTYISELSKTNVVINNDNTYSEIKPENIYINKISQTHLILPERIIYFDFGNPETVVCDIAENTENILRISAIEDKFDIPTNLSFVTEGNAFYTYNLVYSENPPGFVFQVGNNPNRSAIISGVVTKEDRQEDLERIKRLKRNIFNVGINQGRMTISLVNVIASETKLFLEVEIDNKSNINYDIDFMKFYIEDAKRNSKTVTQQIDIDPIYTENIKNVIESKEKSVIIFTFDKFTISKNQVFNMQINEKKGARNIVLQISENVLTNAIRL